MHSPVEVVSLKDLDFSSTVLSGEERLRAGFSRDFV
jgi:hypothetical protein